MSDLMHALRGARHATPLPVLALGSVLVVGAGGTLGSAVLAEALAAGRFSRVLALVREPVASTVRGFVPLHADALAREVPLDVEAALIVFERQRHSNGRDDAFVQPAVQDLLPVARQLRSRGVRRLLVVVPHAPALLPQALVHGFASLDEAAVAELGFEHLVVLRAAQDARPAVARGMARLAALWLAQLRWMVPQRQQSLRAVALARCAVQIARLLALAPPGTRVIAPEQLWLWSQNDAGLESAIAQGLGLAAPP
jgi:uncharacterized protein YbjT (DUF2867 family)